MLEESGELLLVAIVVLEDRGGLEKRQGPVLELLAPFVDQVGVNLELRRDLTRVIRQVRPDRVIVSDPTMVFAGDGYINHPDHRAAAEAGIYAVFPSAETRPIFPELLAEGLAPHHVNELYIEFTLNPTVYVDTSQTIERKHAALRCHKSQLGDAKEATEFSGKWDKETGERYGTAYAEQFKVMRFNRDNGSEATSE